MAANMIVSFACSMQVQTFRKVHGYGYASTMCIGNLRSGTESLSVYLRDHQKGALKKAAHYYGIIRSLRWAQDLAVSAPCIGA